ncbi:helix-turn-helix domain-containing protein [Streptomyces sp. NPDC058947]|uniref:helix-turn-helix domain-containing protein n=1 Tax=Streptomyces sp. NPDC058947 TaxID=3346675 RepID=UPI00369BBB30
MERPVKSKVRHGMASCGRYGCDLDACQDAFYRARKRSKFDVARGVRAKVDATEARKHGVALKEAGMPPADMAEWTGLSEATVSDVISGRARQIHRDTAEAILALPIPDKNYRPRNGGLLDVVGAQRKLCALSVRGFTVPVLVQETGVPERTITDIRGGWRKRIQVATDRAIDSAYRRLWDADPADFGIPAESVRRAREWAHKQGWPPPAAWDEDTIKDPKGRPKGLVKTGVE